MANRTFSFDQKKKLSERIEKISSRRDLVAIKKIIVDNNPQISFMKNNNGYFMQFHNLSENTYRDLTTFIEELDLANTEKEMLSASSISESVNSSGLLNRESSKEKTFSKKLKFTTTENHILNRRQYENELEKNEQLSSEIGETVFMKKK